MEIVRYFSGVYWGCFVINYEIVRFWYDNCLWSYGICDYFVCYKIN